MTFREATIADIPQIQIVRHTVKENVLSNPALVTDKDCEDFLTIRGKGWVCEVDNQLVGFAIADLQDHNMWALFLRPEYEGQGIGKQLQNLMLIWYFNQTTETLWLGTAFNTRAEKFYRLQGWKEAGMHGTKEIKFEMTYDNWTAKKEFSTMKMYDCFTLLIAVLFFLSGTPAHATDSLYTRRLVDTLSSPYFQGRGYTNDGMKKAAGFIETEMKGINLSPVNKNFQQHFNYPVNVFDGDMSLSINGVQLRPGKDFIIGNESHSTSTKGQLTQADSVTWINSEQRIIIILVDKLTWDVEGHQADYTSFRILKSALKDAPKTFEAKADARLIKSFDAANVIGMVKGTAQPDSFVVFTAHYDHLGGMGNQTYFPGANDNASGTALLLSLAKHYAQHPPKYSVVFMAFGGEEAGLIGSEYFVNHSTISLKKIRFLTNLDLMGNGEEGITVVNATEFPKDFELLQKVNAESKLLTTVNSRGEAKNSDHYWFTEKGVPSFFIYTLGKRKWYHDVEDIAATLPLYEMDDLQTLLVGFSEAVMK